MNKRSPKWKMSIRRIPENIYDQISSLHKDEFVISCLKKISKQQIEQGLYTHLHIVIKDGILEFPDLIVPSANNGISSRRNVEGREQVFKDEPKVQKTYSMRSPNFGDWSKGSHEVDFERDVYLRDYVPPKELAIKIERMMDTIQEDSYIFKFTIDEILNRTSPDLKKDSPDYKNPLLFNINLLQENVGNYGVFPSDASQEEYIKSLYVNWEIIPPGERDGDVAKILRVFKTSDPAIKARIQDRYNVLVRLRPINFIHGINQFRRYFGAQFADDLVVFENIEYGNAIYIMFDDWQALSQKSRTELLSQHSDKVERIPHTKTWKLRLHSLIRKELLKRKKKS